ncbi:MAG TPA: hypothetical protein VN538_11335 [Clostridia bacterium]|nr:hypothetical protein [Syntrophomonas sp.]HWQ98668.1 hypothetical protein [Clostridia bacterium]
MSTQAKFKHYAMNTLITLALPVLVILVFAFLTHGRSLNARTLLVVARQSVMPIIITMALVPNMTLNMIDFSAGAVVVAASIIGTNLMNLTKTGIPGLVLFCLLTAVALTTLTGFMNEKLRVPTLVLTIGLILVYESLPRILFVNGATLKVKYTSLAAAPWIFIVLAIVFVGFYLLYNKSTYGQNIRALGGSEEIAKSAGLNVSKIKMTGFMISGIFLGVASVLYISTNGQVVNVMAFGSMGTIFDAFLGVFIAMFLSRYCNFAIGIVVGVFTMALLSNGFIAMGLEVTFRSIATGLILLLVLGFSANQERIRKWQTNRERAHAANAAFLAQ